MTSAPIKVGIIGGHPEKRRLYRPGHLINEETLHDLGIPGRYADGFEDGIVQSMALAYRRLASDLRTGTHLAPTFDGAVELQRLIDRIERTGQRRTMRD